MKTGKVRKTGVDTRYLLSVVFSDCIQHYDFFELAPAIESYNFDDTLTKQLVDMETGEIIAFRRAP